MKIEKGVVSKDLAVEMEKLGCPQESVWYWVQNKTPENKNLHEYGIPQDDMPWFLSLGKRSTVSTTEVFEEYSAYTAAEMGEKFPENIKTGDRYSDNLQISHSSKWYIGYRNHFFAIEDIKLADVMAKMWIYLEKQGLLK